MVQNNDVQQKKMIHTWGCESATVEYYEGKKKTKNKTLATCAYEIRVWLYSPMEEVVIE